MLCSRVSPGALTSSTQSFKKLADLRQSPGSLSIAAWEEELENDVDREFILNGLKNGFDIIDCDATPKSVHCDSHRSAMPSSPHFNQATQQVLKEIEMGNSIVVLQPPEIISPIGVIPKPDGGVRLIHDCSRPDGLSVNDYCSADWKQKFSTVDDAASLVTPGCFMAKVDLKSAYRSVPISQPAGYWSEMAIWQSDCIPS